MSVLFYHVGFAPFRGGYVGVDVFFVISGFLITRLIRDQVIEGTFSFFNFYIRRARRLFPAMFVTYVVTFLAGFELFSPQDFARLGGSLLFAVLSVSNFYFWSGSGYFDADASVKPLLHTWSLGVEEQFYLFWPVVFFVLLIKSSKWGPPVVLFAIGVFSFYLNRVFEGGPPGDLSAHLPSVAEWFTDGRATIFYLAPFRAFEFAIGASLVWLVAFQPRKRIVLEPFVWVGLALIAYPVFTYTQDTLFPSVNALAPCVGTGLLIFGGTASYSGKLLRHPLAVGIGLISYSLYLVHWPIIVFYSYYKVGALSFVEQGALCFLSLIAALAMYRFVERPFRQYRSSAPFFRQAVFGMGCVALAFLVALPGAAAWTQDGWRWRLTDEMHVFSRRIDEGKEGFMRGNQKGRCHFGTNALLTDTVREDCLAVDTGKVNVLLFGDSHASMYAYGIRNVFGDIHLMQITSGWCLPTNPNFGRHKNALHACPKIHELFHEAIDRGGVDIVVVSARWTSTPMLEEEMRKLETLATTLEEQGVRLYVLGPVPELKEPNPKLVAKSFNLRSLRKNQILSLNKRSFEVDDLFRQASRASTWEYFSVVDAFCADGDPENCDFLIGGQYPHTHDAGHLSPWASDYVIASLRDHQGLEFSDSD